MTSAPATGDGKRAGRRPDSPVGSRAIRGRRERPAGDGGSGRARTAGDGRYGPPVTWKRTVAPVLVAAAVLLTGCDQTAWLDELGAPATPTDAAGLAAFLEDGTASITSAHLELEVEAAG